MANRGERRGMLTPTLSRKEQNLKNALLRGRKLTDEEKEFANSLSTEDFIEKGIPLVDDFIFPKTESKKERGKKPGWKMVDGSNFWSVDEKDPYWKTKRGFKEAMDLYGKKPGWVKEPTLTYNPKTGEYEEIEKEEFVDLKPTKRISL